MGTCQLCYTRCIETIICDSDSPKILKSNDLKLEIHTAVLFVWGRERKGDGNQIKDPSWSVNG